MTEFWAHWARLVERAFLDAYERAGDPPPEGAKGHGSPAFVDKELGDTWARSEAPDGQEADL
eukprot:4087286-Alexandrium_andersonii.AAC.1